MVHLNALSIGLSITLATIALESLAEPLTNTVLNPEKNVTNTLVQKISQNLEEKPKEIDNCLFNIQEKKPYFHSKILLKLTVEDTIIPITVTGNTAFTTEELLARPEILNLIQKHQEKKLTVDTFNQFHKTLANTITEYYFSKGYITSKATINSLKSIDQNSIGEIVVIEGQLSELQLLGRENLSLSYICDRLLLGISSPLNIIELEEQLRLLSINPLFESVDASIQASGKPGLSVLVATIKENNNWEFGVGIDNFSPPSIGSNRSGTFLKHTNITGFGDNLSVSYYRSTTDGANTIDAIYQLPLNAEEGTLQLRVIPTWTRVTQDPLDEFNITGNKQVYEISFRQPLWRSLSDELALSLGFYYQNGQTLINGESVSLENARNRSTVFQFGQDYLSRDEQGFWFLRSQFNWGVDLFDATVRPDSTPDSRFVSWLFQGQRLQQWNDNHFMIIRGEIQLTPDSLLPDQWFLIGGGQSVRGYRQNIRFGDNGFRLSIEDRMTIIGNNKSQSSIEIAPFLDMGSIWFTSDNANRNSSSKKFLMGTGLGLIWNNVAMIEGLKIRVDYGIPLISLPHLGDNLQEQGLYFQINYSP